MFSSFCLHFLFILPLKFLIHHLALSKTLLQTKKVMSRLKLYFAERNMLQNIKRKLAIILMNHYPKQNSCFFKYRNLNQISQTTLVYVEDNLKVFFSKCLLFNIHMIFNWNYYTINMIIICLLMLLINSCITLYHVWIQLFIYIGCYLYERRLQNIKIK